MPSTNGDTKLSAGYDEVSPTSSHKENSSSLLNQLANLPGFNPLKARIVKQYAKTPEEILPTAVEKSLPWRRDRSTYNFGMCTNKSINNCSLMDDQRFMLSAPCLSYILCYLLYSVGAFLVIFGPTRIEVSKHVDVCVFIVMLV